MSLQPDAMSPVELAALNKFRKSVKDILDPKHNDYFLLRWLRARNWNTSEAENMLRKHMIWRKTYKVDDILKVHVRPEVIKKYCPLGHIGFDKEGSPVWLMRYGEGDFKGLLYSLRRSEIMREFTYILELNELLMERKTEELGKNVGSLVFIVDLENFALHKITWAPLFDMLKTIIVSFEDNYPERLKSLYIIKAPAIFHVGLALLRPFVSERTFNKIKLFSTDGWKSKLLEIIDASMLPVQFGGTRVGPNNDVNAYDLVPKGRTVPTSLYIKPKLSKEDESKTVEIGAQLYLAIKIPIQQPQSVLNWEFKTKECDIGFGVFYKDQGKLIEVIANQKLNCHIVPESGSLLCDKAGIYILKFDNSYSWVRSKTLSYYIDVIPPGKEDTRSF